MILITSIKQHRNLKLATNRTASNTWNDCITIGQNALDLRKFYLLNIHDTDCIQNRKFAETKPLYCNK